MKYDEEEWSTDYSGRCGNCHERLGKNDKYCRYCGTKRGEGKFRPYQNLMQCIYGPMPVKRVHRCKKCGKKWETILMIDDEKYCPDCGGISKIVEVEGKEKTKSITKYLRNILKRKNV